MIVLIQNLHLCVLLGIQTSLESENCTILEQDCRIESFVCDKVRFNKTSRHKQERQPRDIVNPALLDFLQIPKENLQEMGIFAHTACQTASVFMPVLGKPFGSQVHFRKFHCFLFCFSFSFFPLANY